ncbi:unnamed protein product [Microthlaspi erraticum]|uniref:MADS-box domain-containing protein n=1 Tax=Microthlaspi erraticum TaxID=1685480 RepID=A0A6D2LAJ0_9BRAS|nr:unnamed protein product [Microthlaspi erraticum]
MRRNGKVVIKKLEEKARRQVTFSKRRKCLLKKAHELSVLCDVPIGLIIFSQTNKLYDFCSHSTSMENLIMRYRKAKEGHASADHSLHPDHGSKCEEKKESMMREIENLKMNLELYGGHGLNLLTYDDLLRFELQLESSLHNARTRKFEIMHQQQQKEEPKPKGKGKEQGSSWEHLMWQAETQMKMMTSHRQEDDDVMCRQVKDEFPFYGEEQPTRVLQLLRTLPPSPSQPGQL